VLEHEAPIGLDVLIELHAVRRASEQPHQRCLTPYKRLGDCDSWPRYYGGEAP
jgi:hypothetical protein